ncbi:MAG TPA: DUF4440 domain-containing protein [Thermoanaerobaculia bacterium]
MTRRRRRDAARLFLGLPTAAALLASAAAGEPAREAVLRRDGELAAVLEARDPGRFRAFFHPDAVFLGAEVSCGPDAIAAAWAPFFDPAGDMRLSWRPQEAGVAASGELAYSIGEAEMVFRHGTERRGGKYLTIWRPDTEGEWKIAADGTLVIYPDGAEVRDLRRAFGGFWPPFQHLGGAVKVERQPETVVEAASGDLAYTIGRFAVEVRHGEEVTAASGGFLTLWKKARDAGDLWPRWVVVGEALTPPR